jgi:hypothetical protein
MAFGKKTAAYDASATETVGQAWERAKSPVTRRAWETAAQWAGTSAIATCEIRAFVAETIRGIESAGTVS